MKITISFYKKDFTDENSKKAYLKACKWLAKNIVNKPETKDCLYSVSKLNSPGLPVFRLELYALLDINEFTDKFCTRCKEFHHSFFINEQYNCNACNYTAFKNQINEKISIKKTYKKEQLEYKLGIK